MIKSSSLALYNLWLQLSVANRIRKRAAGYRGRDNARSTPLKRLGVLGIMKNEAHLIEEWLEHYLTNGADVIFLIDNGSTDDTLEKVKPWLDGDRVRLVQYAAQHLQEQHYWSAFQEFRIADYCEWLAVADIDEFWFCKSGENLADYLGRQTEIDAVYSNTTIFGSSGFEEQPKSARLSFTSMILKRSRFTKCIFRTWIPSQQDDIGVHFIRKVPLQRTRIANSDLQINHYVPQSRNYWFNVRMKRGDAYYVGQDLDELAERFEKINRKCSDTCTLLRDIVLKKTRT